MPRTPDYVSPFDGLIKKPADRRAVIASGVAAMLTLPAAAAMAASAADGEEWPEFYDWLATVLAYEERDRNTNEATLSVASLKAHDAETDRIFVRIFALAEAVWSRPVLSDRHLAMVAVVACWHMDRTQGRGRPGVGFDLSIFDSPTGDLPTKCFVLAACRRAAVYFPQVPFVFPVEA